MNLKLIKSLLALAFLASLAGCATKRSSTSPFASAVSSSAASAPTAAPTRRKSSAQQTFFAALSAECGRAFAGRIVADRPAPTGADPFAGKRLVMHVHECTGSELRIPFHVGDDRSRTWVLTRTPTGLRLKHDHRHADGSEDKVTQYGGDTQVPGTAIRPAFPVDEYSKAMFLRENLPASVTNIWAFELHPGNTLVYELSRPGGRLFRVEFDLSKPVANPPPPWGNSR